MKLHLHRPISQALAIAGLCATAGAALATPITDPAGDFLPTYDPTLPKGGDLDVLSAEVILNVRTSTLIFTGTFAAPVGTTPGALYVWGLDRGQGTERFLSGSPAIGAGVFFDSVVLLRPDGTGVFNDLVPPPPVSTPLPIDGIVIDGNTITAELPLALFPSEGFAPADYTWNLWPRLGTGQNNQISDFAPNEAATPGVNTNAAVSVVPEPGLLALFVTGLAGLAGFGRRQYPL